MPQRARRATMWVATAMVLVSAMFPTHIGALLGGTKAAELEALDAELVELRVEGMTCDGCAAAIRDKIMGVPGVFDAAVDLEERRAVVALDPMSPASVDAIIEVVEAAGYDARLPSAD